MSGTASQVISIINMDLAYILVKDIAYQNFVSIKITEAVKLKFHHTYKSSVFHKKCE